MVSLTPQQFCRSATFHQRQLHLRNARETLLARPTVYEHCDDTPLVDDADAIVPMPSVIKRLGWDRLTLEPEHLTDRVVDVLQRLDAQYELSETVGPDATTFSVHARLNNVAMRVLITQDSELGLYRISCTRIAGETFAYHEVFRKLRGLLSKDEFAADKRAR